MRRVLQERARERKAAIRQARKYALKVQRVLGPLTAILYGSYGRGDFNLGSDIDVLIVSDALPHHPLERGELLYALVTPGVEPKGYTPAEFQRLIDRANPLAHDALKNGVLLADNGFWKALRERVKVVS